jgi:hypothetical protein
MGSIGNFFDDFLSDPTGVATQIVLGPPDPLSWAGAALNYGLAKNYRPAEGIGQAVENYVNPPEEPVPPPPPDPAIAAKAADEEARRKSELRRKRLKEGGRTSTFHSIGGSGLADVGGQEFLGGY